MSKFLTVIFAGAAVYSMGKAAIIFYDEGNMAMVSMVFGLSAAIFWLRFAIERFGKKDDKSDSQEE